MNSQDPKQKRPLKNAIVLTGVAFQMGITIYLFVMLGRWLDETYTSEGKKLYIIITTLVGLVISLYVVIRQLNKLNS